MKTVAEGKDLHPPLITDAHHGAGDWGDIKGDILTRAVLAFLLFILSQCCPFQNQEIAQPKSEIFRVAATQSHY